MGLGALYLIHLLAQDYMKIRKPAAKLAKFLLTKRDLDAVNALKTEEVCLFLLIYVHNFKLCNFSLCNRSKSYLIQNEKTYSAI